MLFRDYKKKALEENVELRTEYNKLKLKEGDLVQSTDKPRAHYCRIHIIVDNWARCEMIKKDGRAYKRPWFVTHIESLTKI